jgi:NAD(P)-dependent dehydrogenase (short-subunit alcohol dehydrogenase family)/acyl dehydratase
MTADEPIAKRHFSLSDQEAFARISGDSNPMHLDAVASRRTMAGAPVVHGVHGAMWALEKLCEAGVPISALASLKVQFPKFVHLDCEVALRIARRKDDTLKAEISSDGMVTTVLNLKFGQRRPSTPMWGGAATPPSDISKPHVLALAEMQGLSGILAATDVPELASEFPFLCEALGRRPALALAQLSTLVGMICPGLHSIFSSFDVSFTAEDNAALCWRTLSTDERFRSVVMEVRGAGIEGEVKAFARPEPVETPAVAALAAHVSPREFEGRTALVIGGSRGLGALTAKLLAAGGARVIVTYAAGQAEADSVVADIRARQGALTALAFPFDVASNATEQLQSLPSGITHAYYFATPRIGQQSTKTFTQKRFEALAAFYVDGFADFVMALAARAGGKPMSILYPSTVFIDERPKGMTEYAMAKAAGEVLAQDLSSTLGIPITTPRIPRVLTDQTAALTLGEFADPVDILLPLLRAEPQPALQAAELPI